MAIKPATKSTKSVNTAKTRKVTKKVAAKPSARVVTSKSSSKNSSTDSRYRFLATAVLIAAGLVAVSIALPSYTNSHTTQSSNNNARTLIAGSGTMYLETVKADNLDAGTIVTVGLYENSSTETVNAVQSAIKYPADKLEFVSIKTSTAFPQEAATDSATKGLIRLARSIPAHTTPLKGVQQIATIEFKIVPDSQQPFVLSVDQATSYLVRSTDNQNILQSGSPALRLTQQ